MTTGKRPASKAGQELKSKKSTANEKTVAASDLSQAKRKTAKSVDEIHIACRSRDAGRTARDRSPPG